MKKWYWKMFRIRKILQEEKGISVIEMILILVVNLIPYFGVDIVCIE